MQIRTTKEASELINLIETLKDSIYKADLVSFNKILQNNAILTTYLRESEISSGNKEAIASYLDRTKEEILKMSRIKLTMAINPDSALLDKMFSWFKDAAGKELLMDISINPGILGGLLVTYKGLYRDFSLKSRLDNYFKRFSTVYDLLRS